MIRTFIKNFTLVLFALTTLTACSKPTVARKVFWSESQSGEAPAIKADNMSVELVLKSGNQTVQFEKQTVEGLNVESSLVKRILDQKQKTIFLAGQYETELNSKLKKRISKLKKYSESELLEKAFKEKNLIKDKVQLGGPELSLRRLNDNLEPIIKFDFINKDQTAQSWIFNDDFELMAIEPAGSQFTSIKALAYPESPKTTGLTTVFLRSLVTESDGLRGDQIVVTTESPHKVSPSDQFQFTPPDEKFDQVQVYYYLQKALSWYESRKLVEKGKLKLSALVHVGYPEKTNAAFYLKGNIRLGLGDDQVFSQIPHDPSIVVHEATHGLIELWSQLPYQGEGGSLNEGFADTITCLMLGTPRLGEVAYKKGPFKRDITKKLKFSEKNGGLYHDSAIVSSYFWSLREKVQEDKLINLVHQVLMRLNPFSNFDEYKTILKEEIPKALSTEEAQWALAQLQQWE